MIRRNHRIAIKTCQNFKHNHFARLVHCCNGVLKDYRLMSIDIITGKGTKANKWVSRYGHVSGKKVEHAETPDQMLNDIDALILFGKDALLVRLKNMAVARNVKVYKFILY